MRVAVAIINNVQGQILLALRQAHQHQGNLWEFPGGKIEKDETARHALVREMQEELGILVVSACQFLTTSHDYGDQSVLLDVWRVTEFSGLPYGREGQLLKWCEIGELADDDFPVANKPIIYALKSRIDR